MRGVRVAQVALTFVPIVPVSVPTVLVCVPTVPLPARSVQPIDRPDRKHGHSVPYRVPPRGRSDQHPVRVCSPRDRSHGRTDLSSARRYSGPAQTTVRMCSALRPIDLDRSRGHGLRRNGHARKEGATCGNKQARLSIYSQIQSVRADVDAVMARSSTAIFQNAIRRPRSPLWYSMSGARAVQRFWYG